MDPFIGQICQFGFNFAPRGWAFCDGSLIAIAANPALFSLLGTTYGGDGLKTFALPDLRGRTSLSFGQGPGLSTYAMGEMAGVEAVTLQQGQMPVHGHVLGCSSRGSNSDSPANAVPGLLVDPGTGAQVQGYAPLADNAMSPQAIHPAGGNQPHENRQPFLALNWCIALTGVFPSRN